MRNRMSRRAFMMDLGKGTLAVAVFGLTAVACSSDEADDVGTTAATIAGSTKPPTTTPPTTTPETTAPVTTTPPAATAATWERVNLGFVSAYILARAGEAAIVDTGVAGSEDAIEASLGVLDLSWGNVGHVIVTHLHQDHQGSLPAVLSRAPEASAYAGAADIPQISSPRELIAVGDGDSVFDLEIIDTPGHTPGHISVYDRVGGLLVAGDALNGADGGVIGANPDFTPDIPTADASIAKLATLTFETVVFGHGEPVIGGASQQVAALSASL
jgi:glyoxylase-like metal-dependent hydrolase (beta-lactamase superfamily II)